jgi:hypothetical protein
MGKVPEAVPTRTIATIVGGRFFQFAAGQIPSRAMPNSTLLIDRLYRCTVSLGLIVGGFCGAPRLDAQEVIAREVIARAPQQLDDGRHDPFVDDPSGPFESLGAEADNVTAGTLDRLHAPLLRRDLMISGAQSCAASTCHAGPQPGVAQPRVRRGAAYQLWMENDPHAQSWRTICSPESVAMMRRLKILDGGHEIIDPQGFDNCLACHNTTARFDEPRSSAALREGVGCAGCHGPSERWIDNHFQYHWSPQSAQQDGFVNAGDLYTRARMCASCHVGDKDRDMNHDIIAAGHPTLRYELATFHAWQPKHWRDYEATDKTAYEAQLWLAGQIAATDASLSLLHARAKDAHTVSEWPEFAAYNCASCHHNLGLDNDREPIAPNRKATAIYSQWNDSGLKWLIDYRKQTGLATSQDVELADALETVKRLMQTTPRPDAGAVAAATREARKRLASWFDSDAGKRERGTFRSDRLGHVVASAAGSPNTFATWESSVQFYLAAVAARESWPGGWQGPLRDVADRIQNGLRYPEMIDVSRYAERTTATGPAASRGNIERLAVQLAGSLGAVSRQPPRDTDRDEKELESRLQKLLDRVRQKTPRRPQPDQPAANKGKPVQPDAQGPENAEKSRRESIDDIRRAIEALQSGRRQTDPERSEQPQDRDQP